MTQLAAAIGVEMDFTYQVGEDGESIIAKIPVNSGEGVTIERTIALEKQEVNEMFTVAAKMLAKVEGVSSSSIIYHTTPAVAEGEGLTLQSVEVTLHSLKR
jgi:hypothetical protein